VLTADGLRLRIVLQ